VKFKQSKKVASLSKQAAELLMQSGHGTRGTRLLTDLVGQLYYTIVFEASEHAPL